MKPTKNILFTFDYELFLGTDSGTVQKCLIEPTEALIKLFDKHKIENAIFFVDTTYLLRLKELNLPKTIKDLDTITQQLIKLSEKGHFIFPHLHPHWLDASYNSETNRWSLKNYSKYRFHNIPPEQRENLFRESILLLKNVLSKSTKKKEINGYRAGGWSIQPFTDFLPFFKEHNIKHEFSVIKGFKNLSEAQYFNFSNCPNDPVYRFQDDPCINNNQGSHIEYTISTLSISTNFYWLNKIWGKYLWKTGQRSIGDGSGLVIKEEPTLAGKNDLIGSKDKEMISIELLTRIKLYAYKAFLKKNNYMHFISHPKMLTFHNLKCFDNFLNYSGKKFSLETDFLSLQQNNVISKTN